MWRRHDPNEKTERDKRNGWRNMVEAAGLGGGEEACADVAGGLGVKRYSCHARGR